MGFVAKPVDEGGAEDLVLEHFLPSCEGDVGGDFVRSAVLSREALSNVTPWPYSLSWGTFRLLFSIHRTRVTTTHQKKKTAGGQSL